LFFELSFPHIEIVACRESAIFNSSIGSAASKQRFGFRSD
jgi:hypothetical protein